MFWSSSFESLLGFQKNSRFQRESGTIQPRVAILNRDYCNQVCTSLRHLFTKNRLMDEVGDLISTPRVELQFAGPLKTDH